MNQGELGAGLKAAREKLGMSLRALAAAVGVSPSLLSQIENGKTNPSVDTLYALVRHLDISVDAALGREAPDPVSVGVAPMRATVGFLLQPATDAPTLEMENGVRWERLATLPGLDVEALRVTYQPGASSSVEGRLMRHLGYEHITLVSGELTVQHEFDTHTLRAGDSMAFDSQRPHLFSNRADESAVGIWYIFGRQAQAAESAHLEGELPAPSEEAPDALGSAVDVLRSFRRGEGVL